MLGYYTYLDKSLGTRMAAIFGGADRRYDKKFEASLEAVCIRVEVVGCMV